MHELSIALAIVETLTAQLALGEGSRVSSVALAVGQLSGVDPSALRFAFPEAAVGTACEDASLEIEEIGIAAYCPRCGEQPIAQPNRLKCPRCQTPTPRIVRGRELEILRVSLRSAA